jgi:hypothetical protein
MDGMNRRKSMLRLGLELVEQSIVLVFLELKLAVLEVKRNVSSAKNGAVFMALGGFLMLFSLLTLTATAIAALAMVLPVWLSALIVTAAVGFLGAALLFTGLGKLKHFTLVPAETLERVENIAGKLKKHAEQREHEEKIAHEQRRARVERRSLKQRRVRQERRPSGERRNHEERRRQAA